MPAGRAFPLDLTPPRFAEGLADWARGDGAGSCAGSCEDWPAVRLVHDDPDLGDCLELRMTGRAERLRYLGETPLRPGAAIEVTLRLRAVAGPVPRARIAAWPGGRGGRVLAGLPTGGAFAPLPADGAPVERRLVLARAPGPGVDLAWDGRALFAHVGLELAGAPGGVVRIADLAARERAGPALPGFGAA
ncbi:hypothetical protein [Amaricoccus sp.]|uniref:hypothetical protein n=1 Tax=Amaricoccus sp. TaxID=1872485 RepID=UPI001B618445|nr:hypothetical protein [Amaricoccus sp.]MBP6999945.1 hypothetical protein [Amaricoccus sp.]